MLSSHACTHCCHERIARPMQTWQTHEKGRNEWTVQKSRGYARVNHRVFGVTAGTSRAPLRRSRRLSACIFGFGITYTIKPYSTSTLYLLQRSANGKWCMCRPGPRIVSCITELGDRLDGGQGGIASSRWCPIHRRLHLSRPNPDRQEIIRPSRGISARLLGPLDLQVDPRSGRDPFPVTSDQSSSSRATA